jgi:hypothetical protein
MPLGIQVLPVLIVIPVQMELMQQSHAAFDHLRQQNVLAGEMIWYLFLVLC